MSSIVCRNAYLYGRRARENPRQSHAGRQGRILYVSVYCRLLPTPSLPHADLGSEAAMLCCPLGASDMGKAPFPDAREITSLAGMFTARQHTKLHSALCLARLHLPPRPTANTEPQTWLVLSVRDVHVRGSSQVVGRTDGPCPSSRMRCIGIGAMLSADTDLLRRATKKCGNIQ